MLGALFRYDNRQRTKTNLMVFLKPTVIRTAGAGATLTNERYDYLMGEQESLQPAKREFWPDPTVPVLPPLPNTRAERAAGGIAFVAGSEREPGAARARDRARNSLSREHR